MTPSTPVSAHAPWSRWLTALGALALASGMLVAPAVARADAASATPDDLTALVNPYVGTENFGNTFPGASAPFGMVQVSPDTGGQGGYDYKQSSIYGFSQTHLSGVGCGVEGELPIMPTTGAVSSVVAIQYASPFSHSDEQAGPGYYQVGLSRYGVRAELTATDRTGWQRYTFPPGQQQNILFNTGQANMTVIDSTVHIVGDHTIEGLVHDGGFCAGHDEHTMFFSANFDRPIDSFGTWSGSTAHPDSRDSATTGGGNGAWVSFAPGTSTATRTIVVKVGLSYTGIAGARNNLSTETGSGYGFDAARTSLRQRWNKTLHLAEVGGGTQNRQVAYYTSLYHSFLHPNLAGDVDGKYQGFDHKVHKATDYTPRQNFSLWDTYRPQNQLLELLQPDVARDDDLSLLAIGREGGWLPRWALANSETNIMTGDPVTPTLVEAWSKGFLAGHEDEAYALLKKNATSLPPADSQYNGRSGVEYYKKLGYIPVGLSIGTDCPSHGGDNDCTHPASATLEYSAADAALSLMAAALGHRSDARLFARRGRWYRNLWDASITQFRPRNADGTWLAPFDPVSGGGAFHESGAYQYQWLVPQDPAGLVSLMGGKANTRQRLDTFFAYDHLLTDPAGTARTDWISSPYDYYAKSTYNPNNEPDLLAPYMYLWAGAPARTATVVRAAMTLFTTGPDGMTGNDDLGSMSAWYVFSSLGLYPTMSGANFFAVSSPQFPTATVTIGAHGKTQGGTVRISAPGVSDTNRYITAATVDGRRSTRSWVSWDDIRHGGALSYTVSATPGTFGTKAKDSPPSIDASANSHRVALSGAITPAAAVAATTSHSITLSTAVVGQWPGSRRVRLSVLAPRGWKVSAPRTSVLLRSNGLPIGAQLPIRLEVPAHATPGRYPVTVTLRAAGVAPVVRTAVIELKDVGCVATSGGGCALDLSSDADLDGTATVAAPNSGNFDSSGWSYDAALLPPAGPFTIAGIGYSMPDASGTNKNFVTARGQQLALPAGTFSALHLIGAAHGGDVTSQARITYTDGSTSSVPFNLIDWAAGSGRNGNTVAVAMDHRIKAGLGIDGPPVQLFATTLALDPTRAVQSITLPASSGAEVYAATLIR